MPRQSLFCVIFAVLLVSIIKARGQVNRGQDRRVKDSVCQRLLQNLDMNPQAVNLATLQKCINRWGDKLLFVPNNETIRLAHNRMQTFLRNANAPSHPRVQPATRLPSRAGSRQPGQVGLKQPNHRTSADLNEVALALRANQGKKSKGKRLTQPTECIQLVNGLLVEPNPPVPTSTERYIATLILESCIAVWKQLEEKAKNNQAKHTPLAYELGLLTARLGQFKDATRSKKNASVRKNAAKEKERTAKCSEIVLRIPLNLDDATTKQRQVQYKTELVECRELWKMLIGRIHTSNAKVVRLKQGLGRMDQELARVKRLLGETTPELADVDSQEGAIVNQPSTSGQGQPKGRGQKPNKPPQVDRRGKLFQRARKREHRAQLIKCDLILRHLSSTSASPAKSGERLLLYLVDLETCVQLWDKRKVSTAKRDKKPKAELVQELAQLRAEIARVNRRIAARECRRLLKSCQHEKLPPPPPGVTHKDHYENLSSRLKQCLDLWTNAVNSGNAQLAQERDQFTVAYKKANLLALRAYRYRQYHPPMGTY